MSGAFRSAEGYLRTVPGVVLIVEYDPERARAEPNRALAPGGEFGPVETQREVSLRWVAKGIKSLELSGWLVLALYSEEARREQQLIPHAARYKLSAGLTKLSRLEAKDWPASLGDMFNASG